MRRRRETTQRIMLTAIDVAIGRFNEGRYFEAHEAFEDLWRAATGGHRRCLQGLIQVCAGLVKHQRGQAGPAASLLRKGLGHLEAAPAECWPGIDAGSFLIAVREAAAAIDEGRPFGDPVIRRAHDL